MMTGIVAACVVALFALQEHLPPEVRLLIEKLGSDRIEVREEAQRMLSDFGRLALAELERASNDADLEVAKRARTLLREMPREVDVSLEEKLLAKAPLNWTLEYPADRRLFVWHASVTFSKDGRRAGFAGGERGHGFNVVNAIRSEEFDWVSRPEFGDHGNTLLYHAGKGERRFFFLDGMKHEIPGRMWSFVLSPDGKRTAYITPTGKSWDSRCQVVVDGVRGEEFENVDRASLKFSPDGKRVAYKAYQNGKAVAVIDGVKSEEYAVVRGITFSPDGTQVVLEVGGANDAYLVLDGTKATETYDAILDVAFNPEGKRLGFISRHSYRPCHAVIDGIPQEPFDKASALLFSPDGDRIAYHAELEGKKFVMIDHARVQVEGYDVWPGVFSANGRRLACWGWGKEGACMIVDGVKGEPFAGVASPIFSPDSRHFAYVARSGDTYRPVIDGVKGESFDFVGTITFSTNGRKACYGVRKGHELWWKVIEVK